MWERKCGDVWIDPHKFNSRLRTLNLIKCATWDGFKGLTSNRFIQLTFQLPHVLWASGCWHYERTLYSRRPLKGTGVSILSYPTHQQLKHPQAQWAIVHYPTPKIAICWWKKSHYPWHSRHATNILGMLPRLTKPRTRPCSLFLWTSILQLTKPQVLVPSRLQQLA